MAPSNRVVACPVAALSPLENGEVTPKMAENRGGEPPPRSDPLGSNESSLSNLDADSRKARKHALGRTVVSTPNVGELWSTSDQLLGKSAPREQTVPRSRIVVDPRVRVRAPERATVARYRDFLDSGGKLPTVTLFELDDGRLVLVDGGHTLAAFVGDLVEAQIYGGTMAQAAAYAALANTMRGQPLKRSHARRAIEMLLRTEFGARRSDRSIATAFGVSPSTVGDIRREIGRQPQVRIGRDGRTTKVPTKPSRQRGRTGRKRDDRPLKSGPRSDPEEADTVRENLHRFYRAWCELTGAHFQVGVSVAPELLTLMARDGGTEDAVAVMAKMLQEKRQP